MKLSSKVDFSGLNGKLESNGRKLTRYMKKNLEGLGLCKLTFEGGTWGLH
jgi:hypothetical protein